MKPTMFALPETGCGVPVHRYQRRWAPLCRGECPSLLRQLNAGLGHFPEVNVGGIDQKMLHVRTVAVAHYSGACAL